MAAKTPPPLTGRWVVLLKCGDAVGCVSRSAASTMMEALRIHAAATVPDNQATWYVPDASIERRRRVMVMAGMTAVAVSEKDYIAKGYAAQVDDDRKCVHSLTAAERSERLAQTIEQKNAEQAARRAGAA